MSGLIALIDCNNFFVSCERIFEPKLEGIPVGVLSNNDSCFISRSNELKALGVKMGDPLHKALPIIHEHNVAIRSGNFSLYSDLSSRIMNILKNDFPEVEIYSIDEAFIHFGHSNSIVAEKEAHFIQTKIKQWTGIPISVGIAKTKTLTKVACRYAKKNPSSQGVHTLTEDSQVNEILKKMPVRDLWGIGHRKSKYLEDHGINTALEFKNASQTWVKKNLSITSFHLQQELFGIRCYEFESIQTTKKNILSSRSFGKYVTSFQDLSKAIATHAFYVAKELREQYSVAAVVGTFIHTNPFAFKPQYNKSDIFYFNEPTDITSKIIKAAIQTLEKIFKPDYEYKKTGVFLEAIEPRYGAPLDLFSNHIYDEKERCLENTLDKINNTLGDKSLFIATMGTKCCWSNHQKLRSPNYTKNWSSLKNVLAK